MRGVFFIRFGPFISVDILDTIYTSIRLPSLVVFN